jgi:hypothetical protein
MLYKAQTKTTIRLNPEISGLRGETTVYSTIPDIGTVTTIIRIPARLAPSRAFMTVSVFESG